MKKLLDLMIAIDTLKMTNGHRHEAQVTIAHKDDKYKLYVCFGTTGGNEFGKIGDVVGDSPEECYQIAFDRIKDACMADVERAIGAATLLASVLKTTVL